MEVEGFNLGSQIREVSKNLGRLFLHRLALLFRLVGLQELLGHLGDPALHRWHIGYQVPGRAVNRHG